MDAHKTVELLNRLNTLDTHVTNRMMDSYRTHAEMVDDPEIICGWGQLESETYVSTLGVLNGLLAAQHHVVRAGGISSPRFDNLREIDFSTLTEDHLVEVFEKFVIMARRQK